MEVKLPIKQRKPLDRASVLRKGALVTMFARKAVNNGVVIGDIEAAVISKSLAAAHAAEAHIMQEEVVEINPNVNDIGVSKRYSFQRGSGAFGSLFGPSGTVNPSDKPRRFVIGRDKGDAKEVTADSHLRRQSSPSLHGLVRDGRRSPGCVVESSGVVGKSRRLSQIVADQDALWKETTGILEASCIAGEPGESDYNLANGVRRKERARSMTTISKNKTSSPSELDIVTVAAPINDERRYSTSDLRAALMRKTKTPPRAAEASPSPRLPFSRHVDPTPSPPGKSRRLILEHDGDSVGSLDSREASEHELIDDDFLSSPKPGCDILNAMISPTSASLLKSRADWITQPRSALPTELRSLAMLVPTVTTSHKPASAVPRKISLTLGLADTVTPYFGMEPKHSPRELPSISHPAFSHSNHEGVIEAAATSSSSLSLATRSLGALEDMAPSASRSPRAILTPRTGSAGSKRSRRQTMGSPTSSSDEAASIITSPKILPSPKQRRRPRSSLGLETSLAAPIERSPRSPRLNPIGDINSFGPSLVKDPELIRITSSKAVRRATLEPISPTKGIGVI